MRYTSRQFGIWRAAFGLYLLLYFLRLLPYGKELFSDQGILPDASVNWTHGILASPAWLWASPMAITILLALLMGCALLLTLGIWRRPTALALWLGWELLYNRNNLTLDPTLPYIGWLLLACALVPSGEQFSLGKNSKKWRMPRLLYGGAWTVLGVSYLYAGAQKLFSPSWLDGSAMSQIYDNPIVYHNPFVALMLSLPPILLMLQTWLVLGLQISAPVLFLFRKSRYAGWLLHTGLHMLFLITFDLVDVVFAMLLFHFFLFDQDWLKKWPFRPLRKMLGRTRKDSATAG